MCVEGLCCQVRHRDDESGTHSCDRIIGPGERQEEGLDVFNTLLADRVELVTQLL